MNAIVISASSDIGAAMCKEWLARRWNVWGTFRTFSSTVRELESRGAQLHHCDLSSPASISLVCKEVIDSKVQWDVLVLAPGTQDPIGPFAGCAFDEWEASIRVNFTSQLRVVREMLPARTRGSLSPTVLFFAGGGTNNAVVNYSAYTVSKISLIKMCELLHAEIKDTKFAIVGPGWVKTKIHDSTLRAEQRAGSNYDRTLAKLSEGDFTQMETVLRCCDWIVRSPRAVVSGRNFSVVNDAWNTGRLERMLLQNQDMYKLRRSGNSVFLKKGTIEKR